MTIYSYSAWIITFAAVISYLNYRFIRLPATVAIMAASLLISFLLLVMGSIKLPGLLEEIKILVAEAHFSELVMNFMLGLLLFAGGLTIDLSQLNKQKLEITLLTIISTVMSAFLVALLTYYIINLVGGHLAFIDCLLFGSLISPTDPIAVLAIFKKLGASKHMKTIVSAESLFNDGVGVVLFITVYKLAFLNEPSTFSNVTGLLLREAGGGILYGLILGWLIRKLLTTVHDHKVEILLTLAAVLGGYTLAQYLMISGPLAMVVLGIYVANTNQKVINREQSELRHFWELIEELLNAILFLLLGFEMLAINFDSVSVIVAFCLIPIVLLIRFATVALPIILLKPWRLHTPYTISILTWGGLRGALAIALALAIPNPLIQQPILLFTYVIVAFSILIQGTTIVYFVKSANKIIH
ncbi:MAG: hypothetical protein A3E87_08925 [Gammaproteobacteria bacterium RIFCSPHIGHO2_12_FULL_35_23]|nr:MAG: hypothetical protein A3E87_08925 [Gammaproteobacteria bacterium RIFCSPHIGHO2_12_FULL_35_23]